MNLLIKKLLKFNKLFSRMILNYKNRMKKNRIQKTFNHFSLMNNHNKMIISVSQKLSQLLLIPRNLENLKVSQKFLVVMQTLLILIQLWLKIYQPFKTQLMSKISQLFKTQHMSKMLLTFRIRHRNLKTHQNLLIMEL